MFKCGVLGQRLASWSYAKERDNDTKHLGQIPRETGGTMKRLGKPGKGEALHKKMKEPSLRSQF